MVRTGGPVRAETAGAGPVIRARRTALGITQQQLAVAIDVSRQTVIAMETGDYAPSVFLALRTARALNASVEDLWGASV